MTSMKSSGFARYMYMYGKSMTICCEIVCEMWKQQPICASNWHRVLENITPAADLNAQLQY